MYTRDSTSVITQIMNTPNACPPHESPKDLLDLLIQEAVGLGCKQAILIKTNSIILGRWVQLKCKYGCEEYGNKLTCPPNAPTCEEMKEILTEYKKALLLHGHLSWQMRYITTKIEEKAFTLGFYKAFGLGAGPCRLCDSCTTVSSCTRTKEARPSMEACGIDVYQTVRNNNLKIETLKKKTDEVNIYGLVLIE
ncbi:MAG: DUF2284 domain-containing protein [Candidatus Brocadiaceae bacterium]|nr:DUF2284 domain-containing protein [Candidatus Brocadiaceae bacterium]